VSPARKPWNTTKDCRDGTLIAWPEKLGHDEVVRFLSIILNEGKAANTKQYHRASEGCQHQGIGRPQVFIGVPLMAIALASANSAFELRSRHLGRLTSLQI
jgi:hypothetical protein